MSGTSSSSFQPTFFRGVSPGVLGVCSALAGTDLGAGHALKSIAESVEEAAPSGSSLANGTFAPRANAAMQCSSVAELLELLPLEYRECVKRDALSLGDKAYRFQQTAARVERMDSQLKAGHLPAFIKGVKAPALQVSKEVRASSQQEIDVFTAAHLEYQMNQGRRALALLQKEKALLLHAISQPVYLPHFHDLVEAAYTAMCECQDVSEHMDVSEGVTTASSKTNDLLALHHAAVSRELPMILGRVIAVQRSRAHALETKAKAKKELKEKVELDTASAIPDRKALQSLIRSEVAKASKPTKTKGKGKAKAQKPPRKTKSGSPKNKKKAKDAGKASKKGSGSAKQKPKSSKKTGKGKAAKSRS
ncbi:hypothetical protein OG21DRAFT_1492065 [Imleria badia]|nr:hypothetical protein OG21DRAFT_1492065 [Imleria badia]